MGLGKCLGCGACCIAIAMIHNKKEIREKWSGDSGNKEFVLANWTRISKEQALINNPNVKSIQEEYVKGKIKVYWYRCRHLKKDKTCAIHKLRLSICRGYPWYGKKPEKKLFLYGENCGYKIDQFMPGVEPKDLLQRLQGKGNLPAKRP